MIIEKLKGNLFSPLDVIELDIVVDIFCSVNEEAEMMLTAEDFVNTIEGAIKNGPHWRINPVCEIFIKNGVFNYEKEILIEDIKNNGYVRKEEELDIHRNVVTLAYPVKLVLGNALKLSEDLLLRATEGGVIMHTTVGEISL